MVIIKPDHVELAESILSEIDCRLLKEYVKSDNLDCDFGVRVNTARVEKVPLEVIEEHYAAHRNKSFFGYMTKYFENKAVFLAVYVGPGVISKLSDIIGSTDPEKASKGSIRSRFSGDSLDKAMSEGRTVRNVIHRSDSIEETERELKVWGRYLVH